jgi:RHS repeat-associated protein
VNQVARTNGVTDTYYEDPYGLPRPRKVVAKRGTTLLYQTGLYGYDGAGDVKKEGSSYYLYDGVSRVLSGVQYVGPGGGTGAGGYSFSHTYDGFGNLQAMTTKTGRSTPTSPTTNRLTSASYDAAGNLTYWNGNNYTYDALDQMWDFNNGTKDWLYLYTADGERIWSYDLAANTSHWTIRDLDGKVLRDYKNLGGNWSVDRDYVYRGSTLLAAVTPSGVQHFHLDHLGTVRAITDAAGNRIHYHTYFPFGEEASSPTQDTERMKFAGHERDLANTTSAADDLDYMHARFYSPLVGRFLSFDPLGGNPSWPGTWNRYAYALGSPLKYLDPYGLEARCATSGSAEETVACTETIEVVGKDPGPKFDPKTGVAGLQSLIIGRWLSGGADHLDLKRNQTTTIGPQSPQKPNAPSGPDYYTLTLSAAIPTPYTATIFGVTLTATLDRNGNLYAGIGPNAGKSLGEFGFTLVAGGINNSASMSASQIQSTLSGFTNNFTVGSVPIFGLSRSGLSGPVSAEVGLASPTIGVSSTYSWYVKNFGVKWW